MLSTIANVPTPGLDVRSADAFSDLLFGNLLRADQRDWARVYLRGLLSTPGRKSIRRMAAAVSGSPTTCYSLQQFISGSSWEWDGPRTELARWVERRASVRAWTVAPVVSVKRGGRSVGVHRRFVASAGRTLNCQLGTGLFLSCPGANFPVDWRLHLPAEWTRDEVRQGARIPAGLASRPLWRDVLDLVADMTAALAGPPVPIVADLSDLDDVGPVVAELEAMGRDFVVGVRPELCVLEQNRVGPQRVGPQCFRREPAPTAAGLLRQCRERHSYVATVMSPDGVFRQVPLLSGVFRPAPKRRRQAAADRSYRLFTRTDHDDRGPAPVWMTNMAHRRLDELLELSLLHSSATATVDCLDGRFGLLDFAGRSFPGWHHHMTLASAAYAYARLSPSVGLPGIPLLGEQGSAAATG